MSYLSQWRLTYDDEFVSRCRASETKQADLYKDDQRPDFVALANAIMRGDPEPLITFQSLLGAAPGFADTVDQGDGTINSSLVADAEIQSAVDADWPTVAALYYGPDGTPL
jgi:hypothetical protein